MTFVEELTELLAKLKSIPNDKLAQLIKLESKKKSVKETINKGSELLGQLDNIKPKKVAEFIEEANKLAPIEEAVKEGKVKVNKSTGFQKRVITPEQDAILKALWYDPSTGFIGRDKLYAKVKDKGISRRKVMDWLKKQETYQLHKPTHKTKDINSIIPTKEGEYLQVDLVDITNFKTGAFNWLLTAVDLFNKRGWVIPIRQKTGLNTSRALDKILNDQSFTKVGTDNGKEFTNDKFKDVIKKHGARHVLGSPHTPQGQGAVERFNGTIKGRIEKWITATGKNNFIPIIPDIVKNYNSTIHRTIGTEPDKAQETEDIEERIEKSANKQNQKANPQDIKQGDRVRIKLEALKGKKAFDKASKQLWSEMIYTVMTVFRGDDVRATLYQVKNDKGTTLKKKFHHNDLQKITDVEQPPNRKEKQPKKTPTQQEERQQGRQRRQAKAPARFEE